MWNFFFLTIHFSNFGAVFWQSNLWTFSHSGFCQRRIVRILLRFCKHFLNYKYLFSEMEWFDSELQCWVFCQIKRYGFGLPFSRNYSIFCFLRTVLYFHLNCNNWRLNRIPRKRWAQSQVRLSDYIFLVSILKTWEWGPM